MVVNSLELHKVSVKCVLLAETGNRCWSRDAGTGVATKADVPCQKAPLRHRASRPVCADATADVQHPKSGLQKYKKVRFASGYESVGMVPAPLRERGNDCLILKMKENEKIRIKIIQIRETTC